MCQAKFYRAARARSPSRAESECSPAKCPAVMAPRSMDRCRALPLLLAATTAVLSSRCSGNPTRCGAAPAYPNGTFAPCGPSNQRCPFNGTGNPGMRKDNAFSQLGPYGKAVGYHIRDLTCGLNECVRAFTPRMQPGGSRPVALAD